MRAHLDLTSNVTDFDVDETFAHILPDHVLLNHVRAEAIVSLSRMFTHLHFETSTRSRQQSGKMTSLPLHPKSIRWQRYLPPWFPMPLTSFESVGSL